MFSTLEQESKKRKKRKIITYSFDFTGKTVIVTGTERRIGLSIATDFAKCGANIVIAGLMDEEFPKAERII